MTKLIATLLDWVAQLNFPGIKIYPEKSDYPDRPKDEVFNTKADEVIAKPSTMTRKPVATSITEKRDKEFWETI